MSFSILRDRLIQEVLLADALHTSTAVTLARAMDSLPSLAACIRVRSKGQPSIEYATDTAQLECLYALLEDEDC